QFSLIQGALILGMLLAVSGPPRTTATPPLETHRARWVDGLWIASVLWKINTVIFAPVWLRLGRRGGAGGAGARGGAAHLPLFPDLPGARPRPAAEQFW